MKNEKNYNLKIERENGSYDEVNFSFRFNKVSENIAFEIKDLLKEHDIVFNKPRGKDFYVILFDTIESNFDVNLILNIIKNYELDENNFGFFITINSEYGHGGCFLPDEIRRLYKIIGGQLDFSYLIGD
ncbi:MAG: hypothetical protein V4643_15090 [Bacteroidota bacterium]